MFPVDDALFENAVIVHYRKARRDITKRRKAVEIRRGKSSETAVAKPCVGLDCVKSVDIEAQIFDGFHHLFVNTHIEKMVSQRASEKELHRHIVNVFCVDFARVRLKSTLEFVSISRTTMHTALYIWVLLASSGFTPKNLWTASVMRFFKSAEVIFE